MRRLLVKDAGRRLGARHGARELALQTFFAGLDWEMLLARRVAAPFVPSVDSGTDTAYFEAVFTRERPVDSEAPTPPPRAGADAARGAPGGGDAGGGGAGGGGGNFLEQLFSFNFGGDKAAVGAKGGGGAADRFADDYHGFTYTRDSSLA